MVCLVKQEEDDTIKSQEVSFQNSQKLLASGPGRGVGRDYKSRYGGCKH